MYPGTSGPHILDCSWQPQSSAHRPADTVLLFDRVHIPLAEPLGPEATETRIEKAVAQTRFFWMMVTIVAKYIARRDAWDVINLLRFLSSVLYEVEWLVGSHAAPPIYKDHPDFSPPLTPSEQVAALRGLMAKMSGLAAASPILRDAVTNQTLQQVSAFCALVESAIT
jgi:hypothetical protein